MSLSWASSDCPSEQRHFHTGCNDQISLQVCFICCINFEFYHLLVEILFVLAQMLDARLLAQITYTSCTICVLPSFPMEHDLYFLKEADLLLLLLLFMCSLLKLLGCAYLHSIFVVVVVVELDSKPLPLIMSFCCCITWFFTAVGQFFSVVFCWFLQFLVFILLTCYCFLVPNIHTLAAKASLKELMFILCNICI